MCKKTIKKVVQAFKKAKFVVILLWSKLMARNHFSTSYCADS